MGIEKFLKKKLSDSAETVMVLSLRPWLQLSAALNPQKTDVKQRLDWH